MTKSAQPNAPSKPGRLGRCSRALLSYLVAGICLFWVFHDVDFKQMVQGLVHLNWGLVVFSVIWRFLAYFCVAWEWQLLLGPVGALPLRRALQAVFAGRFANDALPLQLGYLVRAALAARWMNVKIISVFPSLIVERLWDGVWIAAGIGLVALFLPLPPDVLNAARLFGAVVALGAAATVFVVLWRSRNDSESGRKTEFKWKPLRWVQLVVRHLVDGVRQSSQPRLLAAASGLGLLTLMLQGLSFLGLIWAYHLPLPVMAGLAVFLMGYVGVCVPSTPAGTGVFQLFVVASLELFGISKDNAAGFALAAFVIMTFPLTLAGFFAFTHSGFRLQGIRGELEKWNQLS